MADERRQQRDDAATRPGGPIAQIPTWKKLIVALSLVLMVAGGAMSAVHALTGPEQPTITADGSGTATGTGGNDLVSGFAPTGEADGSARGGEDSTDAAGSAASDAPGGGWSPAMFKLGFSFFVGFAVAFALRTFVKISIIAIGMFLLVHFALEYYGFISVNWDVFSDRYDSITDWLGRQTGSFRDFITGSLPSAGSAIAGMVLGFRKS